MAGSHVVQQGEFLAKIAAAYGFRHWQTIYNHPQNADFRKKRPNPNVLFPGDVLYIPPIDPKTVSRPTGQKHVFVVSQQKVKLKLVLKDHAGKPMAGVAYTLEVGDSTFHAKTDGQGVLQHEIPKHSSDGHLTLDDFGLQVPVKVGHLDPIADADDQKCVISGVQARLNNLGFFCGEADGVLGPRTKAALKSFQRAILGRDNPAGEADQESRDKLLSMHGC